MKVVGICTDIEYLFMERVLSATCRGPSNPLGARARNSTVRADPKRTSLRVQKSATRKRRVELSLAKRPSKPARTRIPEASPTPVPNKLSAKGPTVTDLSPKKRTRACESRSIEHELPPVQKRVEPSHTEVSVKKNHKVQMFYSVMTNRFQAMSA